MTMTSFIQHLSAVLEKQTQEITKLKEWLEKNSANNNDDDEDREGFQNYIEQRYPGVYEKQSLLHPMETGHDEHLTTGW